jgi:transcriptional regulator with XRE-family HTH domain
MPMTRHPHPTLSDQLRRAIQQSALSRYRIAKETGVSQSVLSLFCSGQRGLSLKAIDALVRLLDLELTPRNLQTKKEP